MSIFAGVGRALDEDSFAAGSKATQMAIDDLQTRSDRDRSLVIVFASPQYDQEQMLAGVRSIAGETPVVGSSTAGEITGGGPAQGTVAVMVLAADDDVEFVTAMAEGIDTKGSLEVGRALAQDLQEQQSDMQAVMIFPDVLAGNGADVVRGLQEELGKHFTIFGGASGDDQEFKQTFQYKDDVVRSYSVVGVGIKGNVRFGVGVRHGWIPIGSPMKVTRSKGSTVYEIDNKPAIDVYKEYFGEENTQRLEDDQAVYTNKSVLTYPFGIVDDASTEIVIRFATDVDSSGSITCAAEIPEGSEIRMMIGNKDQAIEASQFAARQAKNSLDDSQPVKGAIIFNCIARHNLFGDEANQEIQAIREVLGPDVPMIGFYTYGEQAPIEGVTRDIKKCESNFHNETVVICAWQ